MSESQDGLLTEGNQTEATQWYADNYKEVVAQKGWKEPNDALKSYTELEKSMGSKVKIPTPESSAEEVSNFYAKIGRPENPDGYEVTGVPDNVQRDEGLEAVMRKEAFDNGIPKAAFEAVMKKYYDSMSQQIAQARQEGETALKTEWADKYDTNLEIAKRFAKEGGDEFMNFLADTGLGNHPVIIKAMFNYGSKTLDDTLIKGDSGGDSKDAYKPQYADSPEMYANGDSDEAKKARAYFEAKGYTY